MSPTPAQHLASLLNPSAYPFDELTPELDELAKRDRLVVVFGASDDLMEFRGAAHEEIGCYGGGTAYVDARGVLPDRDTIESDDEIADYVARKRRALTIEAQWDRDGYSWVYATTIPHATFEITEDGEPYCRGIVFSLDQLHTAADHDQEA